MLSPKIKKYVKRIAITLSVLAVLLVGLAIAASYYLKDFGISYTSFDFEFPNEITIEGLRYDTEDVLLTADYAHVSIRLRKLLTGEVSGRYLETENMYIELRPGDPNDTSTFELSDLIPIEVDRVTGTNIHYQDKEGLDSTIVDLPTLYATNFVLDNGIFVDSISSENGTLIISFPDTTESDDTAAAMADLIHLNANYLGLENAHIQFNYPDEVYNAKQVNVSLNGFGTDNPIDFKLNNLSMLYQDSIALSSNGQELSISQPGDLALQDFGFQTPLFDVSVRNAGATAKSRYYATLNQSQINSNVVALFMGDTLLPPNTDILLDGGVAWDNDSIIFDNFKIVLDKKTRAIANGYAIFSDSLEQTNVDILTFKSSLFELQRLFDLDEIKDQKDIAITSQFLITGNLQKLNVDGAASLNKNRMVWNATYAQKPNDAMNVQLTLNSRYLYPHEIVTAAPEELTFRNLNLVANTSIDSSTNIENLVASFKCTSLKYGDYKLTHFKSDAKMSAHLTQLNAQANEQNFKLHIQTKEDVLNADSIHYTGLLDIDIPQLTHLENIAGNAHTPINGYFLSTEEELAFAMNLDSLLFTSDSLENDYLNAFAFQYKSDTTYGIAMDLKMDKDSIFRFIGDPQTFEWMSADEIDTANYPYFEADAHLVIDSNLFAVLVGDKGSVNISSLSVKTTENSVALNLVSPLVVYDEYRITNTDLNFSTNFKTYHGNLVIDSLKNPYSNLDNVQFKIASSQENKVETDLYVMLTDFGESIDFGLFINDSVATKNIKFEDGRPVKFGTQNWNVSENEGATFNSDWDLQEAHFKVTNDSQRVAFTTQNKVIDLGIENFEVLPLYTVLTGDSVLSGKFNLQAKYMVPDEKLTWEGSLDSIKIDTIPIGNFTSTGLLTTTHFESHEELKHQASELFADVEMNENQPFQYKINLAHFDLTVLNPLYAQWGFEGEIDGAIDGKLEGTIEEDITAKGYVNFDEVTIEIKEYGMYFAIPNSRVNLTHNDANFSNFVIQDVEGEKLTLNGFIPLKEGVPVKLEANTKKFKVVNQPQETNKMWGELDISSHLKISGTHDNLSIGGKLNVLKSSNLGYKYHSDVEVNQLDDEIIFTSFSDSTLRDKEDVKKKVEGRINWNVDLDVGKSNIYILLSEVSNDFVRMDASGHIKLRTGRGREPKVYGKVGSKNGSIFYDAPMVSDLNLKIKYATIEFVGDLENPIISFKGTETFRVSTSEMEGHYGEKGTMVPVEVIATVKESPLDEFEITFDLKSENGEMGSYIDGLPASTRETYAMNLLVFGSMNTNNQGGNSAMRAVVSKLNEISRRNIKSADLTFYVDSDKNINVNNLQGVNSIGYDFSREFFNEKIKVTVGGEVVLETYANDGRKQFNPLGNVEIDYMLKEDPDISVYMSKKDSYLGPIDGQVDKYSVGLSFSKWFKNLFYKNKSNDTDD